jgi:MFS family permease
MAGSCSPHAVRGWDVGLLLTLTLTGDTAISLWLTTTADRFGRRRTLVVGAVFMDLAGIAFVSTGESLPLLFAATIGVITPSGNEIGPFLSVEQAALSHIVSDRRVRLVQPRRRLIAEVLPHFGHLLPLLAYADASEWP